MAWVCLQLVGCAPAGPKTVPVKGTLTIDGKAANNVQISLVPLDSSMATATGQVKDGSFELFSGVQGTPGAMPGKYKVVLAQQLSGEEAAAAYKAGMAKPGAQKLSFPEKYRDPKTSDQEVELKAGPNDIKIDIPGS